MEVIIKDGEVKGGILGRKYITFQALELQYHFLKQGINIIYTENQFHIAPLNP